MKKLRKIIYICLAIMFIIVLLIYPQNAIEGAKDGIILASSIIVPTLFPFTVATIFAIKTDVFSFLKPTERFLIKFFGQNCDMFSVMLLSLVGGYPIGAKLINELYKLKKINQTQAHYMLCYCVNAGPAFVISSVGIIILNSKSLGVALFVSHIFSSFTISLFCSYWLKREIKNENVYIEVEINKNAFTDSIISATDSIIKVSASVILFSSVNKIIGNITNNVILKNIILSFEITNAVINTENIYLIAFWLGFSCINIWLQVFAITNDCGVNVKQFVFSRFLHGILNFLSFNAIVHIFNIKLQTLSNNLKDISYKSYGTIEIGVSLLILIVFLIFCLENKNRGRKPKEDLI